MSPPTVRPRGHTIEVFRHHGAYLARFLDRARARRLDVDTLPLPYSEQADPLDVLHHLAADNPHAFVVLAPASPDTRPAPSRASGFRNARSMS